MALFKIALIEPTSRVFCVNCSTLLASKCVISRCIPCPGAKSKAAPMPTAKASVLTSSKYTKPFSPIEPTSRKSSSPTMPEIIVKKIIGPTIHLRILINQSMPILLCMPSSGIKKPTHTPATIASTTQNARFVSSFFIKFLFALKLELARFITIFKQSLKNF